MDFPKKQAQRLIPLYLLEYSEKLFENHPDPTAPWGGGGDYTAGYGIDITNDQISIDQDIVATKNDLNEYIKDNDSNYSAIFRGQYVTVKEDGAYTTTTYGDGVIGRTLPYGVPGYTYSLPNQSGTIALTSDIPSLSGYATEEWVQNQGYITSAALTNYVTTTMLEDALDDYALKTDLPENVSDLNNDAGYTTQTWVENQGYLTSSDLTGYATESWVSNQGYITGITSSDVIAALGYTPGTSNFSGSYNDLTNKPDLSIYAESSDLATVATTGSYNDLSNKPTIPDAVSGTNDGTNWTSLTIGSDTYDIPQGGSTPGMIGEVIYDVPNGEAGVNPITMAHSFADYSYVDIQYRNYDNAYEVKCVRVYDPNGKQVYLDWDVLANGTVYAKKSIYELSGTTMTVKTGSDMQAWYSNGSTVGTQVTATTDYQHQIKITKVIGYKANSSALTTEEWTFTLSDNTTVTKKIVIA